MSSWKIDSITDGGKIYDLVDGAEHGKGAVMTGEYKLGGTNIYLYYTERAKANITIKYQSEDVNKATFTKEDYTAQGYLNTQYNISGTTYLPETTPRPWLTAPPHLVLQRQQSAHPRQRGADRHRPATSLWWPSIT